MGWVHIGPVGIHQLVLTGPTKDQLGPVATGPNVGLNQFISTRVCAKCNVLGL